MTKQKHRRSRDKVPTFQTLLGKESSINGRISGTDNIVITGDTKGTTELEGAIMVMAGGSWEGDIKASLVYINGKVKGNIVATSKLEILASANIEGSITSPLIAIAEGAIQKGPITMPDNLEVVRFKERRPAVTIETLFEEEKNNTESSTL